MPEAPALDAQSLRRTQSTGNIPPPPRARLSTSHRRSEQNGRNVIANSSQFTRGTSGDVARNTWLTPSTRAPTEQSLTRSTTIQQHRSWYSRLKLFLGLGHDATRTQKAFISVSWTLTYNFLQVAAIISVLSVASTVQSPTGTDTQIDACGKPLVAWNCIWIVRACLSSGLAYWNFVRIRKMDSHRRSDDAEPGNGTRADNDGGPHLHGSRSRRRGDHRGRTRNTSTVSASNQEEPSPPYSSLFARLSLLSSMFTLTWFLTAHILQYTSVDSCRLSAPLVWWLTFAILCTMYVIVLEVLVFGFLVFMVLPFIMLFYSIILLCLGRHPLQNPHYIKPEIGKLSKAVVDRIPLVVYIPPPPEDDGKAQPISLPKPIHSYPPKPPAPQTPRKRFAFFRRKPANKSQEGIDVLDGEQSTNTEVRDPETWEDNWEQCKYPFVRLEGNRAACAICLMDFEEPKRLSNGTETVTTEKREDSPITPVDTPHQREEEVEIPVERITEQDRSALPRLEDAGAGPQPLRLLACGHVFHKTCIDPWLTDVSGRCPVCQRAVELDDVPPKSYGRRRRS